MKLSVVVLARNEAELIGECIDSVKPLSPMEILVIDDDSTDDTASIAQYKKAHVIHHKKKDFAEARNFGLEKAKGEWLLYIDADERVSPELAKEIREILFTSPTDITGYTLRRVNYYLGKRWPFEEKITRLFRRENLKGWFGELHESARVDGEIEELTQTLFHFTHRSLAEMVENTIVWSEVEAKLRFDAGHPPVSWWRMPRVMVPTFIDYYIKQGGWRLGTIGLIESIYQAFSIFITYARLWEMQNNYRIANIKNQKKV